MKITEKEFNALTGEETITERNETAAEKKAREKLEADYAKAQTEAEAKATARQAIADRLGLTADELAVLLG
jgi:predicted  nucleic acid-binding Zn-ribbon protein